MICYDIVNPSDACTFLAPDRLIAVAALALIGEGHYAGCAIARDLNPITKDEADAVDVPFFLSGISQPYDDWWPAAGFPADPIKTALETRKPDLIAALRSCAYGDLEDRRTYQSAIAAITDDAKRAEFKKGWEDRRRSSINRIVQRAWAWADRLEKTAVPA